MYTPVLGGKAEFVAGGAPPSPTLPHKLRGGGRCDGRSCRSPAPKSSPSPRGTSGEGAGRCAAAGEAAVRELASCRRARPGAASRSPPLPRGFWRDGREVIERVGAPREPPVGSTPPRCRTQSPSSHLAKKPATPPGYGPCPPSAASSISPHERPHDSISRPNAGGRAGAGWPPRPAAAQAPQVNIPFEHLPPGERAARDPGAGPGHARGGREPVVRRRQPERARGAHRALPTSSST